MRPVVPLFFTAILFFGLSIQVDFAGAYNSDCVKGCVSRETGCMEKVKDSPNVIEKELCEEERIECSKRCEEEYRAEKEQQEKEQELKEQEQKATWEAQGLTLEEQEGEKRKLIEIEIQKRHEEREERNE
jgi:hypothetical protein